MKNKKVLAAFTVIAIATLFLVILVLDHPASRPESADLVATMLRGHNCEPPCFFGEILQGRDFDEVSALIAEHEIMRGVELEYETRGNEQTITWKWPNEQSGRLASTGLTFEEFFQYRTDNFNYIDFYNGEFTGLRIVFLIRLEELIALWGEPDLMYVGIYRSEAAALSLAYSPSESFITDLYCSNPALSPNTPIWAYIYSRAPHELNLNYAIEWTGYDNPKLACNFPPP